MFALFEGGEKVGGKDEKKNKSNQRNYINFIVDTLRKFFAVKKVYRIEKFCVKNVMDFNISLEL